MFKRITSAPGRLLNSAATSFKRAATQRIVALTIPNWTANTRPDYFDRTFENYIKEGYSKNEIIYSCVNATAETAASVALRVYMRDNGKHEQGMGDELPDHPLSALIRKPNREMSEYDFWTWTITYQLLAGVAYWQKIRNSKGQVIELWPIRPDYVHPDVTDSKGLTGYRIHISGIDVETIDREDMIEMKFPDPLSIFDALSPIEVLSRTADVDNSITDLIKMLLQKGAMPFGAFVSKQRLDDDQVTDIRRRLSERYGGYSNWMEPAVLDSDASWQRIGMTIQEMNFEILDGRCETRICMVLRVPPIIIGATAGLARSTFSNYESARKQWWEDRLSAYYKRLADAIQMQLAEPDFGTDIEVRWDFSKVPALQEERNARWQRATAAVTAGVITVNMGLVEMGLPTVGKEGDVFLRSSMITAVPNDPSDDEHVGSGVSTEADTDDDTEAETETGDTQPVPVQGKSLSASSAESAVPIMPVIVGKPLSKEAALEVAPVTDDEVDSWFEKYKKLTEKPKAKNGNGSKVHA